MTLGLDVAGVRGRVLVNVSLHSGSVAVAVGAILIAGKVFDCEATWCRPLLFYQTKNNMSRKTNSGTNMPCQKRSLTATSDSIPRAFFPMTM